MGQVSMRLHTDDLGESLASRTRGARVPLGRRGRAGEYTPACGSEKGGELSLIWQLESVRQVRQLERRRGLCAVSL